MSATPEPFEFVFGTRSEESPTARSLSWVLGPRMGGHQSRLPVPDLL